MKPKNNKPSFLRLGEIEASIASAENSIPTFAIQAYSGAALRMPQYPHPIVIDLAGLRTTEKSRPALLDHDTRNRVGHTTEIRNLGDKLEIDGVVSASGEVAREVVESARNGFPWQASVGVQVVRKPELIAAGKKVTVNNREFVGPVFVARDTVLREISFTALGVDDDTSSKVAASEQPRGVRMNPDFVAWLEASGFSADDLSDAQTAALQASFAAIEAAKKPKKQAEEAPAEGEELNAADQVAAEIADSIQLAADIREICASYDNPTFKDGDEVVDLAAHALRNKWSRDKVTLEAMRGKLSAKVPAAHVSDGASPADRAEVLEAAILSTHFVDDSAWLETQYKESTLEAAHSATMRSVAGRPLSALMHECIRAAGRYAHPALRGDQLAREYLAASSAMSTISLPGILGNVAHKASMKSFLAVPQVWKEFAGVTPVSDFKTYTTYRLTGNGIFEEVGKDGEIKHGTLSETSYTNRLATYGRMYAFTRQDVINDDLGLLDQIRKILGRQAALSLNKAVFTKWMATADSFWHANNGNLVTASPLDFLNLGAVSAVFEKMTDENGDPIVMTGAKLLVPSELRLTAERLYQSETLNETTTANKPMATKNIFAGKFPVVSSPYLSNSAITGYSATTWYMVADPSDMAALQVAFLDGKQTPTIESEPAPLEVLGVRFRGYMDFGAARWEKRAAIQVAAS